MQVVPDLEDNQVILGQLFLKQFAAVFNYTRESTSENFTTSLTLTPASNAMTGVSINTESPSNTLNPFEDLSQVAYVKVS